MTGQGGRAYEQFLVAWADDELLIGHHIAHRLRLFCVPTVEEYLSLASIGQDELGHADLIMGLFISEPMAKERHVYEREPADFRACQLARLGPEVNGDWARVVARGWVYDGFELARIRSAAALGSDSASLDLFRLMEREEAEHLRHWEAWIRLLARTGEGKERLESALNFLAPFLGDFAFPGDVHVNPVRRWLDEWLERATGVLDAFGIEATTFRRGLRRRGPAEGVVSFAATISAMQEAYRVEPGNVWG